MSNKTPDLRIWGFPLGNSAFCLFSQVFGGGFFFLPLSLLLPQIMYNGQPITKLACGAEFSMIMDCKGNLYSFGCPEYGQLGTVLFWGALLKFCAIVGLGEKTRPASTEASLDLQQKEGGGSCN